METKELAKTWTTAQLALATIGCCPYCEREVCCWKSPSGSFAPEVWATLREHGIDPATGHKENCPHKVVLR